MKVLFPLHLFFPSRIGGPANTLYWLCKGLVKNGHKVTVVATKMGIDDEWVKIDEWMVVDGIKARYCNTESKFSFSVIRHSIEEMANADTVVFSSICLIQNLFLAVTARIRGKQIVWSPRGELFDTAVQGNKAKRFYFSLLRFLLGKYILFHATSDAEKNAIQYYFPKSKVVIIPNYMELPARQFVDSNYTDFLFVGRIAPLKALDKLIEGLAQSKLFKNSQYRFVLVGGVEKQFEEYYKRLIDQVEGLGLKDKVLFAGSMTGKSKFQAYASARYSFLVSNSENFGNVVIEALSQGTPVVASKGTPWESLPKQHAGFWINNSPKEIGEIVDIIIKQPDEEYYKYREGAWNYSRAFDIYGHVSEWEDVLKATRQK